MSDQVVCTTDVLATLAGILGVELKPGQAEDSFDAREAFFAAAPGKPVRDHVILQSAEATYAVRAGDWKLVERENPPPVPRRNRNAEAKAAGGPKKASAARRAVRPGQGPRGDDRRARRPPGGGGPATKLLADARQRGHTR